MANVTVYDKKLNKRVMEALSGETLMQCLGRNHVFFHANCGGNGRCRQCEVLVDGVRRRSCKYQITHDCKVVLPFSFSDSMTALTCVSEENQAGTIAYSLCVDLGTTTIAMALLNQEGRVMAELGFENSQRVYGADVAARIQYASTEQGLKLLQELALADIRRGKQQLFQKIGAIEVKTDCYVSGNTVMLHILGGVSPESIGSYPFTPKHPEYRRISDDEIGTLHLLPCASGYIGSDVTVGAFYYHLHHKERPCFYLDLGTNGEMLLGDRNHIFSTSVAAGPAFEQFFRGSEALAALSALRQKGVMDEHGTLQEEYLESGYLYNGILVTQEAIRQLQLAKGAVRAGIEILCYRFGCSLQEVNQVFVAGGFGFYLREEDARFLGMFPDAFAGKITVVGNASLSGTVACHKEIAQLQQFNEEILNLDLSLDEQFQERYVKYMEF